jgi:hypothetical protein
MAISLQVIPLQPEISASGPIAADSLLQLVTRANLFIPSPIHRELVGVRQGIILEHFQPWKSLLNRGKEIFAFCVQMWSQPIFVMRLICCNRT